MSFWSPQNIAAAVRGRWLTTPPDRAEDAKGISIDSRTIRPGEVYLALKGDRHDGHDFVAHAANNGASMVLVENAEHRAAGELAASERVPVLVIDDARRALRDLASAYRDRLDAVVIGVTGSSGKTTTVRMLEHVLSASMPGTASARSFNNDIGVPLTILGAGERDRWLVSEVGMNNAGEIAPLRDILRPHVGLITHIGTAHIGNLGSRAAIAREKASLLSALPAGGLALLPVGEPLLEGISTGEAPRRTFGESTDADLRMTEYSLVPSPDDRGWAGRAVVNGELELELPLPGRHNALNALAALGAARHAGVSDEQFAGAIATMPPVSMRFEERVIGGIRVVNDAYNANPESMRSAIETFAVIARDAGRRIVVLGDMLELGDDAAHAHDSVADFLGRTCPPDLFFGVGEFAGQMAERLAASAPRAGVRAFGSLTDDAACEIADQLAPGDAVLIKASRSIGLDRLIGFIGEAVAAGES